MHRWMILNRQIYIVVVVVVGSFWCRANRVDAQWVIGHQSIIVWVYVMCVVYINIILYYNITVNKITKYKYKLEYNNNYVD